MRQALRVVLITLLLSCPVTLAHATIVPVVMDFDDPLWSGSFSFNDALGQLWVFDPLITAYPIVEMLISFDGVTWTEDELVGGFPPLGGALVDSVGTVGLFVTAIDSNTNATLHSVLAAGGGLIGFSSMFAEGGSIIDQPQSEYSTSIPAPATLLLLGSGLAGLGAIAWRRRRRAAVS